MNLKAYDKMRERQRRESAKRAKESDKALLAVSGHALIQSLYDTARKTKEVKRNA